MTRLRACYPQRVSDDDHWPQMVARYYDALCGHDPELLGSVIDGAWQHCPSFFPSLGELEELYRQASRRRAGRVAGLLEERAGWNPDGVAKARAIVEQLAGKVGSA